MSDAKEIAANAEREVLSERNTKKDEVDTALSDKKHQQVMMEGIAMFKYISLVI